MTTTTTTTTGGNTSSSSSSTTTSSPTTTMMMSVMKLNPPSTQRQLEVFKIQQQHFRSRRLDSLSRRKQRSRGLSSSTTSNKHWRRRYLNDNDNEDGHHDGTEGNEEVASLELANCHLVLWSGEVSFGTPPQTFRMDFDTGSSDIWIPSSKCHTPCRAFPDWRKYDSAKSATYEIASHQSSLNEFNIEYEDGETVHGEHAIDVLQIDTLKVSKQVFAQVTDVSSFSTCESEEGVFGLGFSDISSHNYPTFLSNLVTPGLANLKHALFSLYLNPRDDYPTDDMGHNNHEYDSQGNVELGQGNQPITASSQIVFGGVDQRHYSGCLKWHDLGQFEWSDTEETFEGYWDFALELVLVGGTSLSEIPLAIVDSGSSYIVGPTEDVATFAHINNAACFQLHVDQSNVGDDNPVQVDCLTDEGFDAAMIECEQPFFNLEFIADGTTYALEKEDLILRVDTSIGPACVLRVVGTDGIPGWILGDAFMNKFYAAFDFANKRVGFALATENSQDVCEVDLPLDITHVHSNSNQGGGQPQEDDFGSSGGSNDDNDDSPAIITPAPTPVPTPPPAIPEVMAPGTDRDPNESDVFASQQKQDKASKPQYIPQQDDGKGVGHIVFLTVILALGLAAMLSVVHRRRKRIEGEKFQEMVSRAERGVLPRDDDDIMLEVQYQNNSNIPGRSGLRRAAAAIARGAAAGRGGRVSTVDPPGSRHLHEAVAEDDEEDNFVLNFETLQRMN